MATVGKKAMVFYNFFYFLLFFKNSKILKFVSEVYKVDFQVNRSSRTRESVGCVLKKLV